MSENNRTDVQRNPTQSGSAIVLSPEAQERQRALVKFLDARKDRLRQYCLSTVQPETLLRLAVLVASRGDQQSLKLLECSHESIYMSLITAAQLGLEPTGLMGSAYLVPYKGVCTLQPGWRGLIDVALRAGAAESIWCGVAHKGDVFEYEEGSKPYVKHIRQLRLAAEKKQFLAAYACARLKGDVTLPVIVDRAFVEERRASSAFPNSPAWRDHWEAMARKTAVRLLVGELPINTASLARATRLADYGDTGDEQARQEAMGDVENEAPVSDQGEEGWSPAQYERKS